MSTPCAPAFGRESRSRSISGFRSRECDGRQCGKPAIAALDGATNDVGKRGSSQVRGGGYHATDVSRLEATHSKFDMDRNHFGGFAVLAPRGKTVESTGPTSPCQEPSRQLRSTRREEPGHRQTGDFWSLRKEDGCDALALLWHEIATSESDGLHTGARSPQLSEKNADHP